MEDPEAAVSRIPRKVLLPLTIQRHKETARGSLCEEEIIGDLNREDIVDPVERKVYLVKDKFCHPQLILSLTW